MIKKTTSTVPKTGATKTTRTSKTKKNDGIIVDKPKIDEDFLSGIKIDIKHKNETQKKLTTSIKNNDVTVCIGPAGTGKSICTIAMVLKLLQDPNNNFKNILLLKSMAQLNGEVLPSLPGDASEKMLYQNMSFFDSLIKLIGEKLTGNLVNSKYIKFDVIGSFRGRSLSDCIIVVDECQNISHDNLKTILTRISDNTKIILLGDPDQIDIKNKIDSSLKKISDKIKSNPVDGVELIEFTENDIVRHRLTSYFINLFKEDNVISVKKINTKTPKNLFNRLLLLIKSRF